MNILVRNLAKTVTERDLVQLFQQFGRIKSINIVIDEATGKSKGFGFVDMPEDSEAVAAIKALDGKLIRGQKARVKTTTQESRAGRIKAAKVQPVRFDTRAMRTTGKGKTSGARAPKKQNSGR